MEDAKKHMEEARRAKDPGFSVPDGFVKVVQMRPARANATNVRGMAA